MEVAVDENEAHWNPPPKLKKGLVAEEACALRRDRKTFDLIAIVNDGPGRLYRGDFK